MTTLLPIITTVIGALLALAGAFLNARLSERSDQRRWEREQKTWHREKRLDAYSTFLAEMQAHISSAITDPKRNDIESVQQVNRTAGALYTLVLLAPPAIADQAKAFWDFQKA